MLDAMKRDFAARGHGSNTLGAAPVDGFVCDPRLQYVSAGLRLEKRAPDTYTSELTSYNLNTGNAAQAIVCAIYSSAVAAAVATN
jgi:hypothetical protein